MKRILLLLAATSLGASPALAQHAGHNMPGMTMPMPAKKPAAKKPAAKKPAARKPAAKKSAAKRPVAKRASTKKAPAKKPSTGHEQHDMQQMPGMQMPQAEGAQGQMPAGHDMSTMPGMNMPGHDMSQMPGTTMPGHDMSQMPGMAMPADQHAGHAMPATTPEPPVGPPPAEALQGPENAADTVFGAAAMEPSRAFLLTREHGRMTVSKWLVDQLETRVRDGRDGYFLNAEGWIGGDIDKLWLKTEIEGAYGGKPEQAEFQALWSHAIDPWFNLQTGIRVDARPRTRGRLVLGVEGLAPYWIEIDAAAFLSDKGDVTARFEAEHDMRITQKLILQPRAELDFSLQDIPRENIGSGLSRAELGLRLRYQFVPNFAPYVGVAYERAFGETRRFLRAGGDDPGSLNFVVGLRTWF